MFSGETLIETMTKINKTNCHHYNHVTFLFSSCEEPEKVKSFEQTCQRDESSLTSSSIVSSSVIETVHGNSGSSTGKVRSRTTRQKKSPYSVPNEQISPVSVKTSLKLTLRAESKEFICVFSSEGRVQSLLVYLRL